MPNLFSAAFIFAKTRLSAVFTVEAALLMALILPVLLSLIYLGFLDHDRGVLQGAACEAAALADNSAPDKARADKLRTLTEEIGKDAVPFLCPAAWSLLFRSARILSRCPTQAA